MNEKKELAVVALSSSESQPGNYVLILEDLDERRRLPIIIGLPEAQSIAVSMEQMQPSRPMTHDLLKNVIEVLGGILKEVVIHEFSENVFFSRLKIQIVDGSILEMDARTSDAIALAVRCQVPIFSFENIILEAGILREPPTKREIRESLDVFNTTELEELLEKVLAEEDYESASKIRDFIKKRKGAA